MPKLIELQTLAIAMAITLLLGMAGGAFLGFKWSEAELLKAERATADLKVAYNKRDEEARGAGVQKQAADRRVADAIEMASIAADRARRTSFSQVTKETKRVKESIIATGRPVYFMPAGWVRLFDSASAASDRASDAGAGQPDAAPGTADDASSEVSEWDVLDVHADNSAKWSACRRQVNDLLDFLTTTD